MQPLDVVKTRMQLEAAGSSTTQELRRLHANAGVAGLWRGFGPGLAIVVPRRGLKFTANSLFSRWLGDGAFGSLLAGGAAGACEALVITPLEVLKVQVQSCRGTGISVGSMAAGLWRRGGVRIFYTGLGATVAKHSAHSMVYFASFGRCQPPFRTRLQSRVCGDLAAGFVAGCAAGAVNNPFDVLKSRAQAAAHTSTPSTAAIARDGVLRGLVHVARSEGIGRLFAGVGAKVARLGPGSAIIFAVYHAVLERLA